MRFVSPQYAKREAALAPDPQRQAAAALDRHRSALATARARGEAAGAADVHYAPGLDLQTSDEWLEWLAGWRAAQARIHAAHRAQQFGLNTPRKEPQSATLPLLRHALRR